MEGWKNWREKFRFIFTIEENNDERYLRKYDHRTIVEELEHFIEEEIEKAREEGIREYIGLLQAIEHYEGLKMVRGLIGLDKHEKRDYDNIQRRFKELSKLKDNK